MMRETPRAGHVANDAVHEDIVSTWGLTKRYGDFDALTDCSVRVRRGGTAATLECGSFTAAFSAREVALRAAPGQRGPLRDAASWNSAYSYPGVVSQAGAGGRAS